MKAISKKEKTDILLVLALAFGKKFGEPAATDATGTILQLTEKSFGAMNGDELADLRARAAQLDELSEENRRLWQEIQLDKLRRRGKTSRLDENINSTQIAARLNREPKTIRNLILKNLPADLSRQIILHLQNDLGTEQDEPAAESRISDEIAAIVKRTFLANFAALEDVYEPNACDKFSREELENFVLHLGLHEVAAACRGINSKEMLAAFLSRFNKRDAREIALYITELEKIRPFWVAQAGEIISHSWNEEQSPEKLLRLVGLKLLAAFFAGRDQTARRFTAQKLSVEDAESWLNFVNEYEKIPADDEARLILEKRQNFIARLAAKFSQNGRL